jgi:hypothetical protein
MLTWEIITEPSLINYDKTNLCFKSSVDLLPFLKQRQSWGLSATDLAHVSKNMTQNFLSQLTVFQLLKKSPALCRKPEHSV